MSIVHPLQNENTILQRLFKQMPASFSRDPAPEKAIIITNTLYETDLSKITIIISDGEMIIESASSIIDSETIDLSEYTLVSLQKYFVKKYQSSGIVIAFHPYIDISYKTLSATCLIEGSTSLDNSATIWEIFTSSNYQVLNPFALELSKNQKLLKNAIAQINLRLSSGKWQDFWGHLLGIDRYTSELLDDLSYKTRIQNDLTFPKVNNIALEILLSSVNRPIVTVTDGGSPLSSPPLNIPAYSTTPTGYVNAKFVEGSNIMKIDFGESITFSIGAGDKIAADETAGLNNPLQEETYIVKDLGSQGIGETWFIISRPAIMTLNSSVRINAYSKTFSLILPTVGSAYGTMTTTQGQSTATVFGAPEGYFTPLTSSTPVNITEKDTNGNLTTYSTDTMLKTIMPLFSSSPFPEHFQIAYDEDNPIEGGAGTYTTTFAPTVSSSQEVYAIPYGNTLTSEANAYKMGPVTGAGTFVVTINTVNGIYTFTREEYARLISLLMKYKPAGISFDIVTL